LFATWWRAVPEILGAQLICDSASEERLGPGRHLALLPALQKAGPAEIHLHDLRHTGNILTATARVRH